MRTVSRFLSSYRARGSGMVGFEKSWEMSLPDSLLPSCCADPGGNMCYADSASHCQFTPFVPGGDGCPLPACSILPASRHTALSFVPPRSSPASEPPDYISSRFLIISYQPTSVCLCSSATRGGIPTAHSSPGSLHGPDTSLWRC